MAGKKGNTKAKKIGKTTFRTQQVYEQVLKRKEKLKSLVQEKSSEEIRHSRECEICETQILSETIHQCNSCFIVICETCMRVDKNEWICEEYREDWHYCDTCYQDLQRRTTYKYFDDEGVEVAEDEEGVKAADEVVVVVVEDDEEEEEEEQQRRNLLPEQGTPCFPMI
jgi:hypothetical protein